MALSILPTTAHLPYDFGSKSLISSSETSVAWRTYLCRDSFHGVARHTLYKITFWLGPDKWQKNKIKYITNGSKILKWSCNCKFLCTFLHRVDQCRSHSPQKPLWYWTIIVKDFFALFPEWAVWRWCLVETFPYSGVATSDHPASCMGGIKYGNTYSTIANISLPLSIHTT